jgi:hypothetical protein
METKCWRSRARDELRIFGQKVTEEAKIPMILRRTPNTEGNRSGTRNSPSARYQTTTCNYIKAQRDQTLYWSIGDDLISEDLEEDAKEGIDDRFMEKFQTGDTSLCPSC